MRRGDGETGIWGRFPTGPFPLKTRLDCVLIMSSGVINMAKKMTWKEIQVSYPQEWVAIIRFEEHSNTPYGELEGEVIAHDRDEEKFTRQLKTHLSPIETVDIRFTGEVLPNHPVGPVLWQISNMNS